MGLVWSFVWVTLMNGSVNWTDRWKLAWRMPCDDQIIGLNSSVHQSNMQTPHFEVVLFLVPLSKCNCCIGFLHHIIQTVHIFCMQTKTLSVMSTFIFRFSLECLQCVTFEQTRQHFWSFALLLNFFKNCDKEFLWSFNCLGCATP